MYARMHTVPCTQCHAHSAMHTVPCTQCHAHSAMHTVPCTQCHAPTKSNNNNGSACKTGARHYYASLLILARFFGCPIMLHVYQRPLAMTSNTAPRLSHPLHPVWERPCIFSGMGLVQDLTAYCIERVLDIKMLLAFVDR